MPQLHLTKDDGTTEVFVLEDGEMLLGREPDCDIQLTFAGISRRHLRLVTVLNDTFIEDLGSRNGTYVNGKLARKCALNDGDVVQIGEIELSYQKAAEKHAPSMPESTDPDATTVISPGQFGPRSRAAREKGRPVEGVSPVAEQGYAASLDTMRPSFDAAPEGPGWWDRVKAWFGR